ncbi:PH domain-containing protein [Hymenobacter chitinivorans]|uniref:PH (Pleckstrin Homology) domain-containing protein n=1 Tax=Hymenobacter chitinivorans DSM 11115 TaxID=1121954 RepID=A0A2M9BT96_9BACT|nr:PH domain-containing protein [Hymenobacter chitinivorans]PJJ61175.1 PH (Pleckstrin Homology) domain-containing protein [Hymenobacter chitinivorans DSM 11115]
MPSIFDQNLLPEFESVRGKDEQILWSGKPVFLPFVAGGLLMGFMGLAFGIIWLSVNFNHQSETSGSDSGPGFFWLFGLLPLAQGIWSVMNRLLSYSNTYYAYSNRRIMMRTGFFGTSFKAIDFDKVSDIEVTVNFIERFYNVGSIQFFSGRTQSDEGNVTKLYDYWHAIRLPYEVFKQVKEVIVDIKTDYNYPNALRPETNPGYSTKYSKE